MSANRIGLRRRVTAKAKAPTLTVCDVASAHADKGEINLQLAPGERLSIPFDLHECAAEVARRVVEALNARGVKATADGSTVTLPKRRNRGR